MTTCKPAPRKTTRPARTEAIPPKPERRLWEADAGRAFEAGVRWFLAVSRAA
jgi:hypothetical protein